MSQPNFLPKEIIAQIDEILPCRSSAWPDQDVLVPVTAGLATVFEVKLFVRIASAWLRPIVFDLEASR
jgi:hypothetical protein